jgi:hypothetical protein
LSLQSICRLSIRRSLGPHRYHATSSLDELTQRLINFVDFKEFICSVAQLPPDYNVASLAKVSAVIKEITGYQIN